MMQVICLQDLILQCCTNNILLCSNLYALPGSLQQKLELVVISFGTFSTDVPVSSGLSSM